VRLTARQSSAAVAERLRARHAEIEQATLDRATALSNAPASGGPEYAEGLRRAVSAAVGYGISVIERGEEGAHPIPETLLSQARLAARSGVSLDTVLRRYFAGHTLLEDFLVEEAENEGTLDSAELKSLLRSQATVVDRLLAAVSEAHSTETERRWRNAESRRSERVERLLAAEQVDTSGLAYDFSGWHLGLVARGPDSSKLLRALAEPFDCRLLRVPREGVMWGWLAFRHRPDASEIEAVFPDALPPGCALAVGEPGQGLAGWRLTHRQAAMALPVALRRPGKIVCYSAVALLALALQDELLSTSLKHLYLMPLSAEKDGGRALCQTLRAYFKAGRNVSSAAAALGVDRHTVTKRLRAVEERIERQLDECAVDLALALALEDLVGLDARLALDAPMLVARTE
jgi:hypothetical protein